MPPLVRTILLADVLEDRLALDAVSWDGGAGTLNWEDVANWTTDNLPQTGDDVTILDAGGDVLHSIGDDRFNSLVSNSPIRLTGGRLQIETTAQLSASLTLAGGTLRRADVTTTGDAKLVVTPSGGTLDDVTLDGALDLTEASAVVTVENGLVLNGTATLGYATLLQFNGTQTLSGNGEVQFVDDRNALLPIVAGMTLTIGPGITVRGGAGQSGAGSAIGSHPYFGSAPNVVIVNQGSIIADTAGLAPLAINATGSFTNSGILQANGVSLVVNGITGNIGQAMMTGAGSSLSFSGTNYVNDLGFTVEPAQTLSLDGTWSNSGGLNVSGGILDLRGTMTIASINLPAFNYASGTVNLRGTLDNTSTTLPLSAATGSWRMAGGTIEGGVVSTSGGTSLLGTSFGGVLKNSVTVNGNLDLTEVSAVVTVENGLVLNGTATLGYATSLDFNGTQTLSGNGEVQFVDDRNALLPIVDGMTLTIGPGITVRGGAGQNGYGSAIGAHDWWGVGAPNVTIVNEGTIIADTAGAAPLAINATGSFTNSGILQANGASVVVNGITGNIGQAMMTGAGSSLSFSGTNYVNDLGFTVEPDQALSLDGSWSNTGGLNVSGGILDLRGTMTIATLNLPAFNYSSGTVNLRGALDNTSTTLPLSAATGSWRMVGGTIEGGIVSTSGGTSLRGTYFGGVLKNSVTVNGDLDLTEVSAVVTVENGLVLNGTATLGYVTSLQFNGTQTLSGNGEVQFVDDRNALLPIVDGMTLTIGPGITVRGGAGQNGYGSAIGAHDWWGVGAPNVTIVNEGTIIADTAGAIPLAINATGSFTNLGILQANGGSLAVNGITGNIGQAMITGAGSSLSFSGTNYVNDLGFTVEPDQTLSLDGSWSNTGGLNVSGGILDLRGTMTIATLNLPAFNYTSGTVNLRGTLDNTNSTLSLDAATGPWTLAGGTILGGTVMATGGANLVGSGAGGTLNAVTLNADFDLTVGRATVLNGLVLNGTMTLLDAEVAFSGTQTLSGNGQVVFQDARLNALRTDTDGMTLTIGPQLTIRGGGNGFYGSAIGSSGNGGGSNVDIVNLGTIIADAPGTLQINATGDFMNLGRLQARNGGALSLSSLMSLDDAGSMESTSDGTIIVNSVFGETQNVADHQPAGVLAIQGGNQLDPTFLEVMSRDLGNEPTALLNNFAYGRIELGLIAYVNLIDQSDNSPGAGGEAIYAESLYVPGGATLDLDGHKFYARSAQIDGTVLNGTILPIVNSAAPAFVPSGEEAQVAVVPGSEIGFGDLSHSAAVDAAGNSVIVWDAAGVNDREIFLQRYDSFGVPIGAVSQVNTVTAGRQSSPVAARAANGDYVVAWVGPDVMGTTGIFAQRFSPNGPLGAEFAVNTTTAGNQTEPTVALDAAGNFAIAFTSGSDVRVRAFDRDGVARGVDFLVWDEVIGQLHPSVAMDAGGDFVVTWESTTADIFARLFTGSGIPKGDRFRVNELASGAKSDPAVAMSAFGEFVVAWTNVDNGAEEILARRYDATGAPVSGDFRVSPLTTLASRTPSIAANSEGDFVITWQSEARDGSGFGIAGQRYDADGTALGPEFLVNTFRTGDQVEPAVAMDSDGDFVITWLTRTADGTGLAVAGQRFQAAVPDRFETPLNNDVVARATDLGTVEGTRVEAGLTIDAPTDADWFSFRTSVAATLGHYVEVAFQFNQGDLSLELHDTAGRLRSSLSVGNSERILLSGLPAGLYRARVVGTDGSASPSYTLTVVAPRPSGADRFEPNDDIFAATNLNPLTAPRLEEGLSIHAANNEDWYRFTFDQETMDGHLARIEFTHAQGDLDLELYDEFGGLLRSSATAADIEEVGLSGLAAGTYHLLVRGFAGATNPSYSLRIEPPVLVGPDFFESPLNDSFAAATLLGPILGGVEFRSLTIHDADRDFYRFSTIAASTGSHELALAFNRPLGDLRLRLFDENQTELRVSTPRAAGAAVALDGLPAGDYFLRVEPIGAATNFYSLTIDAPASEIEPVDEWTILVYMTASDLSGRAFNDINELERAAARFEGNVNVVVYMDQSAANPFATGNGAQTAWSGAGRAVIEPDQNLSRIATTFAVFDEEASADPARLLNFVRWGVAQRPADRTALILWGHGLGVFGSNFDNHDPLPNPVPLDALEIEEVGSALATLETVDNIRFDIVGYDASLMGMAEVIGALAPHADVVLASEQVGESLGFDYDEALGSIIDLDLEEVTAAAAASQFVESYKDRYSGRSTLSAFRTDLYDEFTTAMNAFVSSIIGPGGATLATPADFEAITNARSGAMAFVLPEFRDLGVFLQTVGNTTGVTSSIRTAAQAAHAALRQMIFAEATNPQTISGLSIYFPDDLTTSDAFNYFGLYEDFDQATRWFDFLEAFTGSPGSRAGTYDPDRFESPERNDQQSLAYRFHALVGSNVFDSLTLDRSLDKDWYRFSIGAPGAGNQIRLTHDHQIQGAASVLNLTLFEDDGTQIGLPVNTSSGQGTISLSALSAGEYLVRVQASNVAPRYTLTIDAPASLPASDHAGGNDTQTKAFELTGIVNDPLLTGFVLPAAPSPGARAFDWFRFDGPQVLEAETKSITVRSPSAETVRVRLLDGDGNEIGVVEGTGEVALIGTFSASETFFLEVSSLSQSAISYSIDFQESSPTTDTAPPTVVGVGLRGSAWTTAGWYSIPAGANQLLPVPWTNLNQVRIVFSENVVVQQNHLTIVATVGTYTFAGGFTYDAQTFTATWVLAQTLVPDKVMLVLSDGVVDAAGNSLDGEWTGTTDSYPSGDGGEGEDFSFRFNVLPGDVNGTGNVDVFDPLFTRLRVGLQEGQLNYASQYDVNADGQIDVFDVLFVRLRVGQTTPPGEPGIRFASIKPAVTAAPLVLDSPTAASNQSQPAERKAKRSARPISASPIDHLLIEWYRDYSRSFVPNRR